MVEMDTIGPKCWYWEASAENFRRAEATAILGQLVARHIFDVGSRQRVAWMDQIEDLKLLASVVYQGHFFLSSLSPAWANERMQLSSQEESYSSWSTR
jgi:hypothetical protein